MLTMLRNPAYKGTACFGKTRTQKRQRVTRPLRLRGDYTSRDTVGHERPREDWIEIPVPALISETTFALAEDRLAANKKLSARRTITPAVAQGIVSCAKCGYGIYRTATTSSARKISYYRCFGSDRWRKLSSTVCDNRPIRQDLLDAVVWEEVVKLIQNPTLIQAEIDRRLALAHDTDPTKRRTEALQKDIARTRKSIDRLLTAYQEDLLSLDELRSRSSPLRQCEQAMRNELQSITDRTIDQDACLRLAQTLNAFLQRLQASADTLDVAERQKIVRLLVKEILVNDDEITIRHSIPIMNTPPSTTATPTADGSNTTERQNYLLRSGG